MWQTTYRDSRVGGASPIGLIIALFDRLVGDLTRAADAIRKGEIERRCRETNHALLVIAQLESWLDRERGGEAARQLALFYAQIRASLMQASVELRAERLDEQVASILNVRSSWQVLDASQTPQEVANTASSRAFEASHGVSYGSSGRSFSQSA
jgi:flagellar protein FliS